MKRNKLMLLTGRSKKIIEMIPFSKIAKVIILGPKNWKFLYNQGILTIYCFEKLKIFQI